MIDAVPRFASQIWGIVAAEVQKLRHDPVELFTRSVQPALWLILFGEVMAGVRGVAPTNMRYLDYLSAGILAQSALFVAIFYGIATIWEHDLGILQRYLVSPVPRIDHLSDPHEAFACLHKRRDDKRQQRKQRGADHQGPSHAHDMLRREADVGAERQRQNIDDDGLRQRAYSCGNRFAEHQPPA